MALFMCPNCQTGMKQINREGVQIDMCPQCQGVWLDRGELQKLLEVHHAEAATYQQPQIQPAAAPYPTHTPQHHQGYHDPYGRGKYRKKSKLESIFDIFD